MVGPSAAGGTGRQQVLAIVLGLLGAAFGLGAGHFVGGAIANGFRPGPPLDWYRFAPPEGFFVSDLAVVAAVVAAVLVVLLVPFSLSITYRDWDRRHPKGVGVTLARARRRGSNSGLLLLFGLILVPAIAAGLVFLTLSAASAEEGATRPEAQDVILRTATIAGFVAAYVPVSVTSFLLARNRLVAGRPDENLFARIALMSGRFGYVTIVTLLLVTVGLGLGVKRIDTNVDVADVLPRGDPNTEAAHNLTAKFKSSFTQQVTFQLRIVPEGRLSVYETDAKERLPNRQTAARPYNISDEVYVRAIDQFLEFAKKYRNQDQVKSPFVSSVALPDFYRIINWTMAGGKDAPEGDAAYTLPPPTDYANARRYATVDEGVWRAIPATADAVISPTGRQTAALLTVSSTETMSGKEIGAWALEIRKAYVEWAVKDPDAYKVFTARADNEPKFSVDLPLANAHSSALAAHDFKTLLPIIGAWLVVTVFLAFRSLSAIGIAISALVLSVVWTFGLMGYMGIPLNTLNLTVIPLIMGVGIDYGIHTLNEYKEARSRGLSTPDTFRQLGGRGFLSLWVATLNTVVGLAVMIVSPSLLIAQLGILACIAISSSFFITITWIPAILTLLPEARAHEYRPSPMMAGIARLVSRYRILVVPLMVLLSIAALVSADRIETEAFGDPPRNWLPKDPLRKEHDVAIQGFYDSPTEDIKANILIFEGDITDPAVHTYMDSIEARLRERGEGRPTPCQDKDGNAIQGRIIVDTLRSLPFFVRTYLTVRDGVPGAATYLGVQQLSQRFQQFDAYDEYPRTKEEMRSLLDEVQRTPLRGLGQLFYDHPEDRMAMMLFSVRAASYEDAEQVWRQVMGAGGSEDNYCRGAVAQSEGRPDGLHVAFFGNTAINYLFVAKELPWVAYMSIVDNLLVMAFVYIPTRLLRPTLVVGLLNLLTGIWWVGVLPFLDVGWAITLTLPLVFIYAIGSDYGLHLVLGAIHSGSTEQTFRTTGKGILFSGVTTFGAFLIYTQMSNLAVQRTMIATAAAIPVIFLVTMLLVPTLYPVGRRIRSRRDGHELVPDEAVPAAPISTPSRLTESELPPRLPPADTASDRRGGPSAPDEAPPAPPRRPRRRR